MSCELIPVPVLGKTWDYWVSLRVVCPSLSPAFSSTRGDPGRLGRTPEDLMFRSWVYGPFPSIKDTTVDRATG